MLCAIPNIKDILDENIFIDLQANSKEELIKGILSRLEQKARLKHTEEIYNQLIERESMAPTGVGFGIAIPHIRSQYVPRPILAAAVLRDGVDFDSVDGEPVKLVFLLLTPADDCDSTIEILSSISQILQHPSVREKLANAKTPKEFAKILQESKEIGI